MVYVDLVGHFSGLSSAARALGVDRRIVDSWKARRIPTRHQLKAHYLSDGKLRLDAQAKREAREIAMYLPGEYRDLKAA